MQFLAILAPRITQFAASNGCAKSFMGLVPWNEYFPGSWYGGPVAAAGSNCTLKANANWILPANGQSGLLLIALAIVDDLLRIATLVAVGYVIYGGFQYMTSNGSPDATKKAQKTIINALVGLIIAILSASIVAFIGGKLGS